MNVKPRHAVITRTPLRISLGGGGTDLPFYYSLKGGLLISAAIDEYYAVSIASRPLDNKLLVQTTSVQFADNINELEHELIRATLEYFKRTHSIQVATFTTLPTGIGLGSSSAQVVGLVNGLAALRGTRLNPLQIAQIAYHIEREILGFAGGVQDQYIAALGGIQLISVDRNGAVTTERIDISATTRSELEHRLVLMSSGKQRNSADIISSQEVSVQNKIKSYDRLKEIGQLSLAMILAGDVRGLGEMMDEHWQIKQDLSPVMSSRILNEKYEFLKRLGSPGGKLVGAGGGGFFLMAVPSNVSKYMHDLKHHGFNVMTWKFDFSGSRIISCTPSDQLESSPDASRP